MKRYLAFLCTILICGCCYKPFFSKVTHYKWRRSEAVRTPKKILVRAPKGIATKEFLSMIDKKVDTLETCLKREGLIKEIPRNCFAVYVPDDWFECHGEQLVPSSVDDKLCRDKGLEVPKECLGVVRPTKACPCPCSARATIQIDSDVDLIVTAPNLKLFTAELARWITNKNNIWEHPKIRQCYSETK
jgi:hypothetical protein